MTRKTFPSLKENRKLLPPLGLLLGLSQSAGCPFSSSQLHGPLSVVQRAAVSHSGWREHFYGWAMQTLSLTLLYTPSSIGTWGQPIATCCSAGTGISTASSQPQGCTRLWSLQKSQNLFCKAAHPLLCCFITLAFSPQIWKKSCRKNQASWALLMQSSREGSKVEPTSPNQPGKTRPPSKEFEWKRNVGKEESEMWCRVFELLVRKKQSWPNPFVWPKKCLEVWMLGASCVPEILYCNKDLRMMKSSFPSTLLLQK